MACNDGKTEERSTETETQLPMTGGRFSYQGGKGRRCFVFQAGIPQAKRILLGIRVVIRPLKPCKGINNLQAILLQFSVPVLFFGGVSMGLGAFCPGEGIKTSLGGISSWN